MKKATKTAKIAKPVVVKTNVKAGVISTPWGSANIRTPFFTLAGQE